MVSDTQLRRWFREYNQRYFGGTLPRDTAVYYATVDGAYGDCDYKSDGRFHIRINPDNTWGRSVRRLTLLHEMVHIAVWPRVTHGPYFEREMMRLASAGAMRGIW